MRIDLPYFGELELTPPCDTYTAEASLGDRAISLDINRREATPPPADGLESVREFLSELGAWRERSLAAIRTDFAAGGEAAYYVDEFLELLEEETLAAILEDADPSQPRREQFLAALQLIRVGFYPDPELYPRDESFAVFDFTIGRKFVDHLVVVKYGPDGGLLQIDVES